MDQQQRGDLVRKYFIPDPATPVFVYIKLAVGLLLFILGLASNGILAFLGFVILAWGGYGFIRYMMVVNRARPKATDAQMDAWLNEALLPIVMQGVQRLSVHPTELAYPPAENGQLGDEHRLVFVGIPDLENFPYRRARGKDGQLRFSAYEIMVVFLSSWRMPVYECVLNMETGNTVTDATREYHLNQVDGVETVSDRVNVYRNDSTGQESATPGPSAIGHVTRRQYVQLVVSGREAIRLQMAIADGDTARLEGTPHSNADNLIATLREHLRQHHHGAQPGQPGLTGSQPAQLGEPSRLGFDLPPEAPPEQPTLG